MGNANIKRGQLRFDVGDMSLQKPRRTKAGFLMVDAYLGRTGVYEYPDPSIPGGVRREGRRPEDIFSPQAMSAFLGVPVTREHPKGVVTPENSSDYQRGVVMGEPWRDGDKLAATLIIYDALLAKEVESGERSGTSPGYHCDLEEVPPGTIYEGVEIHGFQVGHVPNHLAVCKYPRGGDEIRVRLDGLRAGGEDANDSPAGESPASNEDTMADANAKKQRSITIDGIPGDADEHVVHAYEREQQKRKDSEEALTQQAKSAKDAHASEKARADALEEDKKKLSTKVTELEGKLKEALSPAAMKKRVDSRMKVALVAQRVLGKKFKMDGLYEDDIKKAVLKKRVPGFTLDGLEEAMQPAYLARRFDEEVTRLEKEDRRRGDDDSRADAEDEDEDLHEDGDDGDDDDDSREDAEGDPEGDDEEEDEEPTPPRRDSREPRRIRPGQGPGKPRTDSKGKDYKTKYEKQMLDAGRAPLPSRDTRQGRSR